MDSCKSIGLLGPFGGPDPCHLCGVDAILNHYNIETDNVCFNSGWIPWVPWMVRPCTAISGARTERSPMIDASEFALHWGVRPNAARGAAPPFTTPMIIIIIIMEILRNSKCRNGACRNGACRNSACRNGNLYPFTPCPHHLHVCMFTEDNSFLWVLAYTAH